MLAANRDEFYDRPCATANFWEDAPEVFGGRDLEAGGSWLAMTRTGRYAAVTNFRGNRRGSGAPTDVRSRGQLIAEFVRGTMEPANYLAEVARDAEQYRGFNLLVGTPSELHYFSNCEFEARPRELTPGLYGLSNHLLDTPWPKVIEGKRALAAQLTNKSVVTDELIAILGDRTLAPPAQLPNTGVGPELEHRLSAAFLSGDDYGTRCSTVILVNAAERIIFCEHSFDQHAQTIFRTEQEFELMSAPA